MFTFWQAIILVGIVAVAILIGTFLGGLLVYRTKREPHEPLVGRAPKGEVFSIDTFEDTATDQEEATATPETIVQQNAEFVDQFANSLGAPK
jgi:hypothetical protein